MALSLSLMQTGDTHNCLLVAELHDLDGFSWSCNNNSLSQCILGNHSAIYSDPQLTNVCLDVHAVSLHGIT